MVAVAALAAAWCSIRHGGHRPVRLGAPPQLRVHVKLRAGSARLALATTERRPEFSHLPPGTHDDRARWIELAVPAPDGADRALAALRADPGVEVAFVVPITTLAAVQTGQTEPIGEPDSCPIATPSFESYQGYLGPAPHGIDAPAAWRRGLRGHGVWFADIEGGWNPQHEDLPGDRITHVGGGVFRDPSWRAHGTAVLGEVVGRDNGRGVVGIATGSARYPGAAILSVGGALAGPTGMIRYAGSAHEDVVRAHPSVVAVSKVGEAGRVQAWLCGSGLGTDDEARTTLRSVLATSLPVVLDADALTLLVDGKHADDLRRDAPLVITPHDGEFTRLAGEAPGSDRVAAACRLAVWINAVVLLKGDRTIVATPAGEVCANPTGTSALATAGSGDVLAGLLASLLAAGLPAERAAIAAAYVHGLAGRRAAEDGPVASPHVAGALREVLADLLG